MKYKSVKQMKFKDISMNKWLISTCEWQTEFIHKKEASTAKSRAPPRFSKPL